MGETSDGELLKKEKKNLIKKDTQETDNCENSLNQPLTHMPMTFDMTFLKTC